MSKASPGNGNGAPVTDPPPAVTSDHNIVSDKLDPTLDFLPGTAAGVSGLVVGFPFDTGE